jgi:hypothetical protein
LTTSSEFHVAAITMGVIVPERRRLPLNAPWGVRAPLLPLDDDAIFELRGLLNRAGARMAAA